ncbi:MAG: pyrimidine dimer DNA glycosylase/endonuclease V [Thermomicrobiales bacterium]
MRIWDVPPGTLCRQHLLGEHRELHALWTILSQNKAGYSRHPETLRWKGKLAALFRRHDELVREMTARGYQHHSPLDASMAVGDSVQSEFVDSIASQREILRLKGCGCDIAALDACIEANP